MFLTHVKALLVTAFQDALRASDHPMRSVLLDQKIWVGMEYPNRQTNFPGFWVDFSPNGEIRKAGVGHYELREDTTSSRPFSEFTRWRFSGTVTITVVTLTSQQRDDLTDEMVRLVAFGAEAPGTALFRDSIDRNDFIAMSVNWDEMSLSGFSEMQGTPWGTNDWVYEATCSLTCEGEFISDLRHSPSLIPLSSITVTATPVPDGTGVPTTGTPDADGGWI